MSTLFTELGLAPELLTALAELGYEAPTPVQEKSIPVLMEGEDLLAQAQTGTGKTAAFALPLLAGINLKMKTPQALVIAPTRELAIQVAEAFQSYAKHMKGFHVAPIYGGQDYQVQLRALKRGPQVIVGTPGRVMDHMRRGSLSTDVINMLVLDEADEMLKMGFLEDVEWILEQIPNEHQTALFSATMPSSIQKIADRYLKDAQKIKIKPKETTVDTIEQSYMRVARNQKLEALTRYLEVEEIDAAIIFARTKNCSAELAEKLQARGYAAAALNGDMQQSMRQKVIDRIKSSSLDIVVATDVAARGIDVERISHVINFDIPYDTESYIHRIGRTGRAGRSGKAILFVTPREHRLLKDIEKAVRKPLIQIAPPSLKEMNEMRSKQLANKVIGIIAKSKRLGPCREIVENIMQQGDLPAQEVAVALTYLLQQANPLPVSELDAAEPDRSSRGKPGRKRGGGSGRSDRPSRRGSGRSSDRQSKRGSGRASDRSSKNKSGKPAKKKNNKSGERYVTKGAGKPVSVKKRSSVKGKPKAKSSRSRGK